MEHGRGHRRLRVPTEETENVWDEHEKQQDETDTRSDFAAGIEELAGSEEGPGDASCNLNCGPVCQPIVQSNSQHAEYVPTPDITLDACLPDCGLFVSERDICCVIL